MTPSSQRDSAAIETAFREMYRALRAADAVSLDRLLAPGFTLTHITGFEQARNDWLADVASRRMAYHSAQEVSLALQDLTTDSATVTARHVVEATIWGSRGRWNLQLVARMTHRDGRWLITRMVATTYR